METDTPFLYIRPPAPPPPPEPLLPPSAPPPPPPATIRTSTLVTPAGGVQLVEPTVVNGTIVLLLCDVIIFEVNLF